MNSQVAGFPIIEIMQSGTFHAVYCAQHFSPNRRVAVRVPRLRGAATQDKAREFLEEARYLGNVDDNGIIPIYSVGQERGLPYATSEFDAGKTLFDELNSKNLTVLEEVTVVRQLAEILDVAQKNHGLIHGDINLKNVIVSECAHSGIGKVNVLGCCLSQESKTSKCVSMDHPVARVTPFMSPEQINSSRHVVDARSQVFNLGLLLYYLITGSTDLNSRSLSDIELGIAQCLSGEVATKYIKPLARVIAIATSIESHDRYPGTGILGSELDFLR